MQSLAAANAKPVVKTTLGFRVSKELHQQVLVIANAEYTTVSEVCIEFLKIGLKSRGQKKSIEDRLTALEESIKRLEEQSLASVNNLHSKPLTAVNKPIRNSSQPLPPIEHEGLSTAELCQRLEINHKSLGKYAKARDFESGVDLLESMGWEKRPRDKPKGKWFSTTKNTCKESRYNRQRLVL